MDPRLEKVLINSTPKRWWSGLDQGPLHPLCWGVDCGDGWARILYNMCKELTYIARDNKNYDNFSFGQIKEKFGTLRVYAHGGDREADGVIGLTEQLSGTICEACGRRGRVRDWYGWYITLCYTCFKDYKNSH